MTRPIDLPESKWEAILASHFLDEESLALLQNERVVDFLTLRSQRLTDQLSTFLQQACEWAFEDTPPLSELVVEDLADGDDDSQ